MGIIANRHDPLICMCEACEWHVCHANLTNREITVGSNHYSEVTQSDTEIMKTMNMYIENAKCENTNSNRKTVELCKLFRYMYKNRCLIENHNKLMDVMKGKIIELQTRDYKPFNVIGEAFELAWWGQHKLL